MNISQRVALIMHIDPLFSFSMQEKKKFVYEVQDKLHLGFDHLSEKLKKIILDSEKNLKTQE